MAFGLKPLRHGAGGIIRLNSWPIASGYAVNLFEGDPVTQVSGGTIEVCPVDTALLGVFLGVSYTTTGGEFVYDSTWPASTATLGSADAIAYVVDDPEVIFLITASAAMAAEDLGELADFIVNAGSATTKNSGYTLNAGAIAATTAQLRIVKLHEVPDNDWTDAAALIEVSINEHLFKTTAGV